jgi:hypothetical protein
MNFSRSHIRHSPEGLSRFSGVCLGLAALAILLLVGQGASGVAYSSDSNRWAPLRNPKHHLEVRVPPSWHPLHSALTDVAYPVQVIAVSSYPVRITKAPSSCKPVAALEQMPKEGVLLMVEEYAPHDPSGHPVPVPDLPRRPRRFKYSDAAYGPFECAGPSYQFAFSQGGRAFQAHVWLKRKTASSLSRKQALKILDSLHLTSRR